MNKAVASVLNKVLGDWVSDLNSEQLNISIFSGEISLQNLHLKENILHILGLPFDLKQGSIGQITIKIPWSSVLSSPMTIEISDIFVYCTPKCTSSWSESAEKQAFEAGKRSSINQFEVLMSTELNKSASEGGGYFSDYASTIANNVQVKINNIYIRYEDATSATSPFAIGLNLKSLNIQTCNKDWEPEYIKDCEKTYKLIAIEDFSVYCDFNIQDCKVDGNNIGEAFKDLVNLEITGKIRHDYLLNPFSFELKIVVSNKVDYNIPKAECSFYSKAFKLNFDAGQIKVFFQLMKFLELYNTFKLGIIKNIILTPIEEIKHQYIPVYKNWRQEEIEAHKKKLEEKLWRLEENMKIEDIRALREEAVQSLEKRKTIDSKLKQIESIKNEKEGLTTRFSNYIYGGSQEDAENKTKEKLERIKKVEEELKEIVESETIPLLMSKSTTEDEKNWEKFKVLFYLENGEFTLADKSKVLVSAGFKLFQVNLTLKLDNFLVNLTILNTSVKELIQISPFYPHLFECSEFELSYNQNPMEISVYCGDIYVCTVMVALYKIVSVFSKAASGNVEINHYLSQANENIHKKIEDGQSFLSSVITEPGPSKPFKLTLKLGAPNVVIPFDTTSKGSYMVINLGKLNCITRTEEDAAGVFQKYKIDITDLQSFIVWEWQNVKDLTRDDKDYLLQPLKIHTAFKKYLKVNYDQPGFILISKFEEINLKVNEKKIGFLFKLQKILLDNKYSDEERTVEEAVNKNVGMSLQYVNPKLKKNLGFMSLKNNLTSKVKEKKSSIQHLQGFEKVIPVEFAVIFKKIELNLTEKIGELTQVGLEKLSVKFDIKQNGDIYGKVKVMTFKVLDLREMSIYKEIVSNPLNFVPPGDQSPWVQKFKGVDNEPQFKILIDYRPKQRYTDVGIVMSELRFTVSRDYYFALLHFYTYSISNHMPQSDLDSEKKSYFILYKTNTRYTLNLKSIELWLVTDKASDSISNFNTSIMLTYTTQSECLYFYSANNIELKRNYKWCKEEADVTLSHLELYLVDPANNFQRHKNIILPCRLSLEYSLDRHESSSFALIAVRLRIESICMHLSITDLQFFQTLAAIWSSFPPSTGQKPKGPVKNKKKTVENDFKAVIDGDAVQLTVIDDTKKTPLSLLHIQISNLAGIFRSQVRGTDLSLDILMFIDFFNKTNGAWEPALEDWKFNFKHSYPLDLQKSFIVFQSSETLNLNLTQQLIENLATLSKKFNDFRKTSKKQDIGGKVNKRGGLEYEVQNKLGILLFVWIKVSLNEDIIEINEGTYCFSQEYVNKLGREQSKILKKSSKMSLVSAPTKLGFSFESGKKDSYEIIIDSVGIHIINVKINSNDQISCLVDISVKDGKRIISFEPNVFVYNHSEYLIQLGYQGAVKELHPVSNLNLPLDWATNLDDVHIMQLDGPNFEKNSEFQSSDLFPLAILIQKYKISPDHYLKVVEIAPQFYLKNLLNVPVYIFKEGTNEEILVNIEDEIPFRIEKNSLYQIRMNLAGKELLTEKTSLFNLKKIKCRFEGSEKSSILLDCEEKVFENNENLLKFTKDKNQAHCKSWTIRLYAEYIVVNQSQFDMDMSKLNIPVGEIRFFSSKKKSKKLKLSSIDSKYCSSFKINTIGVSKAIKISQEKKNAKPKDYLFGVYISKAPNPLFLSKIITVAPRFLIWNYLEIPICVQQFNATEPPYLLPESSKSKSPLQFHFEDYSKSKFIIISDSSFESNEKTWSAPFLIEKIQDFQIKFSSSPTPAEEKMNVFIKGWHVPVKSNQVRYVRVYIHSHDEATIHIVFLEPKDADFRVVNKTEMDFKIKQKKCERIYELPSDKSLPWVWDSFQKERKVQILAGKKIVTVDIENLNEKTKSFMGFKVYNQVNGVSRELIIENSKEEEPQEVLVDEIKGSKMANAQKIKRIESISQKNTNSTKASPAKSLFNMIQSTKSSKTSLWLKEIGISILDKNNNEMLYLNLRNFSFKYRLKTSIMGQLGKIKTGVSLKLEHFQIDYMGQKTKLFPVILYPVRHTKQYSDSNKGFGVLKEDLYYFFTFEVFKESNVRIKNGKEVASIDKYNHISVRLQDIQIKLNEEIIYLMLEVKDFFNCFHEQGPEVVKDYGFECFQTDAPKISFEPQSFQSKAYFNYIKIDALSILVTFKRASNDKKSHLRYDTGFFIVGLIKNLGGAFVNVSESPISFKSLTITHSFTTFNSFISTLMSNYKNKGIQQFYKIFGSIDIIGNPLGLIGNIAHGIYEFFGAPIRGLRSKEKGGFIKGVGKGVRSLFSGVIEGGFGSVSKISGSLYNVLRTATGDKVIIHDIGTEDISKKMAIGFKDCVMDITNGIGNTVMKPYRGAVDNKTKGFFQGFFTGTFGLITVPLKVALKLSNVLTTTITSTSILITKGKIQKYGRNRFPRQFGVKKILEPYNVEMAEAQDLMKMLCKGSLKSERMVYYTQFGLQNKSIILILTSSLVLYLEDEKLKEQVKINSIIGLEIHVKGKLYFLGIVTKEKNVVVTSGKYSALVDVYFVILSQNENLPSCSGFVFEVPPFVDDEDLGRFN